MTSPWVADQRWRLCCGLRRLRRRFGGGRRRSATAGCGLRHGTERRSSSTISGGCGGGSTATTAGSRRRPWSRRRRRQAAAAAIRNLPAAAPALALARQPAARAARARRDDQVEHCCAAAAERAAGPDQRERREHLPGPVALDDGARHHLAAHRRGVEAVAAEAAQQPEPGRDLADLRHAVHGVADHADPGVFRLDVAELPDRCAGSRRAAPRRARCGLPSQTVLRPDHIRRSPVDDAVVMAGQRRCRSPRRDSGWLRATPRRAAR